MRDDHFKNFPFNKIHILSMERSKFLLPFHQNVTLVHHSVTGKSVIALQLVFLLVDASLVLTLFQSKYLLNESDEMTGPPNSECWVRYYIKIVQRSTIVCKCSFLPMEPCDGANESNSVPNSFPDKEKEEDRQKPAR